MIISSSPLMVFLSAFIFSICISLGFLNHIVLSFFYIIFIFIISISLIHACHKKSTFVTIGLILVLVLCNHLGILLGFSIASGPDYMLWPTDAIDHHLPNSIAFSKWILGEDELKIFSDNPFSKIYISNMWVGFFFAIFGVYPFVSAIAMLVIKLLTVILIYKSGLILTNEKFIALVAAIIYSLLPTITFYTIQFYKDFFIQFLVALILYIISKSLNNPKRMIFIIFPLALLFIERFYLLVIMCATLVMYYWMVSRKFYIKFLILIIGVIVSFIVLDYYFPVENLLYLYEIIKDFESAQNESIDVTPTTNFTLDLIRIAFTPFFNFYKLEQYQKFDSLLIFGGFIHQLIMLFYFKGLWTTRKNKIILINFAFLFLMILLAMIMPYDGRARDSFYPFVSVFAAIGLHAQFNPKKLI